MANMRGQDGFFTNAYLGLRTDRTALDEGLYHKEYDQLCGEFLEFQITSQAPRLIVVLGDRPNCLLHQVVRYNPTRVGCATSGQLGQLSTTVVQVSHPYSDLNKNESALMAEANILSEAWLKAAR
jgi:hypothetical protein